jgi:hypothetical protein
MVLDTPMTLPDSKSVMWQASELGQLPAAVAYEDLRLRELLTNTKRRMKMEFLRFLTLPRKMSGLNRRMPTPAAGQTPLQSPECTSLTAPRCWTP